LQTLDILPRIQRLDDDSFGRHPAPIARALIGKRVGDIVTVRSPKTDKEYEITNLFFR